MPFWPSHAEQQLTPTACRGRAEEEAGESVRCLECCMAMANGPSLTAFIPASTTSALALKSDEALVVLKMERNKHKFLVNQPER
jgi:hypothetical protein